MGNRTEGTRRIGGDAAEARLVTDDASERGGDAYRAASIGPEVKDPRADGRRYGRPSGRTARRLAAVPRIARDAVLAIVGYGFPTEFRSNGKAEDNRSGFAQMLDRRRIRLSG